MEESNRLRRSESRHRDVGGRYGPSPGRVFGVYIANVSPEGNDGGTDVLPKQRLDRIRRPAFHPWIFVQVIILDFNILPLHFIGCGLGFGDQRVIKLPRMN